MTMDERKYQHERRRQQRLERLRSNDPRCIVCGEQDIDLLEFHHIAGRKFGNQGVIACLHHHRKLTNLQKDHPIVLPGKPTARESVGRTLLGVADVLELRGTPPELLEIIRQLGLDQIEDGLCLSEGPGDDRE